MAYARIPARPIPYSKMVRGEGQLESRKTVITDDRMLPSNTFGDTSPWKVAQSWTMG